ncbi:MAG: molybdopterin-binding protein [Rickettsiaceae bacterium]|nr:molybdopterin-binding protein [Rickettsiaceae bacterium]
MIEDKNSLTAAILIIGNEILSGMTQDQNVKYIAQKLILKGIDLMEVRIIPDIESDIIENVNHLRKKYDYLFTTGGIGPTHDDITSSSIAKALGVKLVVNKIAYQYLQDFYHQRGQAMLPSSEKMALIPENAELIDASITKAPGFVIENVFVMAGIPSIMQDMFNDVDNKLQALSPFIIKHFTVNIGESRISEILTDLQNKYAQVNIGSYPFKIENLYSTKIVFKSKDEELVDKAMKDFSKTLKTLEIEYV